MVSVPAKERGFSAGASDSQGAADSDGGSKKSSVKKKKGDNSQIYHIGWSVKCSQICSSDHLS